MNQSEIQDFIRHHEDLFWYIPQDKKEKITPDLLVETILNYGTLEDVKELIRIAGKREVAEIFSRAKGRKALNYFPEIHNLFSLYFSRNA